MITDYQQYAQEVGVEIPRGEAFAESAETLMPAITPDNVQIINLTNMLVPGYYKYDDISSRLYTNN